MVIPPESEQPVEHLIIHNENDCYKLRMKKSLSITVHGLLCNTIAGTWSISGYSNLQSLIIEDFSLEYFQTLTISSNYLFYFNNLDNPLLQVISFGDWCFFSTQSLQINSMILIFFNSFDLPMLKNLTFGAKSFYSTQSLISQNTDQLETLVFGVDSFDSTTELSLSSIFLYYS